MSTLAPTLPRALTNPYHRADAAWKHLIETGPKWFMDHVWRTCLDHVRESNAWPYPGTADTFHPRTAVERDA